MELLRGTAPKVRFYGPTPDTDIDKVTYSVNGVEPSSATFEPVAGGDDAWEAQLPYIGSDTNDVEVVWHFTIDSVPDESFDETFSYEAVTPILSKQEILRVFDDEDVSMDEVWEVEAAVRHIIQSHTGQKFGLDKNKTLTVLGDGERALRLPERLINVRGVNTLTSSLAASAFIIISDGWYVKKAWAEATARTNPKDSQYWGDITDGVFNNNIYDDADDGYNPGYNGLGQLVDPTITPTATRHGGVTVAPAASGRSTPWKNDYPFEITGDWGYKTVPANVKEAAKLLVNDYACMESAYRDRYLKSIRAADWRLEFSSQAWSSTGNARADLLLDEYVLLDWAVV